MIMELYNNIQGYDLCTCNYYIKKDRNIKVNSNIDEFDVNKSELYMYIEKMQKDFLFNPLWNKIYKASIIKENNIRFEETIQNGEDYLFNVVYLQYVTKANYISHPLYYYVINEKSLTKKYTKRDVKSELKIVHALRNFYVKNSFEMKYVYNQYIELFKNNMINLQNGELEKDQKKLITKQFVCEFKKEDIKKGNLTLENRILYNLIYKERINLIKHYFKFRNDIKNILK